MKTSIRASLIVSTSLFVLFCGLFQAPRPGLAAETRLAKVEAVHCPMLRLEHWKASSDQEKMAFLFGFATMLEIEREWQGSVPVPLDRSLNSSWTRGFAGVTIGQMRDALDRYVTEHPDQLDKSVVWALGRMYVRPKLSAAEHAVAGERVKAIRQAKGK
ncbi:hypothetical protein LJC59_06320 [Desulfovibrio sp. OttesenSCG-928-A18]|nr:hypothetical protein [Desulfovibrio sp. OttesenSCG-928-A18]